MTDRTTTPATTAQLGRLSQLGVHDLELKLMVQRHYTEADVLDLIGELTAHPAGTGALRHLRLFGEYPRGRAFERLPESDRDAVTAWNIAGRIADAAHRAHRTGTAPGDLAALARELDGLARAGNADADGNPGILGRIEAAGLAAGPLDAPELAELLRRAATHWRALAERQRERKARAVRMASALRRAASV